MFFGVTDITLSQLAKCTGLRPRTLQFWTLNGVIQCDPETEHGGPGVPRRYSEDEVAVALVLSEIIRMPLQVGALREIAERFREIMHFGPENGITDPVHWETSHDEEKLWDEAWELAKSQDWKVKNQGIQLKKKHHALRDWAKLQLAIRGIRSLVIPDYGRQPVEEQILELAVDDIGRWRLSIEHAGHYSEEVTDKQAPPVWSLRLLLNLTRIFTRMPSRSQEDGRENGGRPK
ncbi:MAG: MerR family transcriptional regulator [Proteobacteria bacterium]|nr:MerR family transcriptional regulator [Pseudomonadota bacterium]